MSASRPATDAATVYDDYVRRVEAGEPADFAGLCRAHPALADALRRLEQVHRQLDSLLPTTLARATENVSAATSAPVDPRSEPLPAPRAAEARYGDLAYLAHGGLGAVYTAIDRTFDRRVAIKFLRSGPADCDHLRERFLAEARLTARMDHPGIAPVFGQGVGEDGRPYYAMQLVEGETLDCRIVAHYERFPLGTRSSAQSLAFRRLLQHLVVVCNTVAYAHGEGILHRDLKPANVVIGQFERVRVLDWGLAKQVAAGAAGAHDAGDRDGGNGAASRGAGYETVAGQPLGTIAFASPEQVAGRHDEVSERSDVYCLGAMLYCVLTGKAPFAGSPRSSRRSRVLRGDFARPRAVHASIDPALEAVCLRAMALSPADRYASAAALGDDLQRWLADEPVSVFREGPARRLARWRRRNRAFARSIAVAATVLVVGACVGIAAQREASRRGRVEQRAEELHRQGEEYVRRREHDTALVTLDAAAAALADETGFEQLQARVATTAARARLCACLQRFEQQFAAASSDMLGDCWARLPHEETGTQRRIANPAEKSADLARGAARAREALGLLGVGAADGVLENIAAADVDTATAGRVRREAAELTFLLAIAVERLGQAEPMPAQAERRREGLALLAQAEALGMRDRVVDLLRADMLVRAGEQTAADALRAAAERRRPESILDWHFAAVAHAHAGQWREAVSTYQVALALRSGEYWMLFRMGKALENSRRLDEAESIYRACLQVAPGDATVQNSLGCLLLSQRRWADAAREFEAVIANHPDYLMAYTNLMMAHAECADVANAEQVRQRLFARPHDQRVAGSAWNHLGLAHERAGDDSAARAAYSRANDADSQAHGSLRNRATVAIRLRDFDAAEQDIDAAIRLAPADAELYYVKGNVYAFSDRWELAVAAYDEALRLDPKLVQAQHNRALQLARLGRFEDAIADNRAVLERQPAHETARWDIAVWYARIGQRDRDPEKFRIALGIAAEFLEQNPRHVDALVFAGKLHGNLGRYSDGSGADDDLAASERLLGEAIAAAPEHIGARHARGVTRLKARNWRGAIEDWQEYLRLRPEAPDRAGICNDLSTAFLELRDFEQAKALLNEAIEARPDAVYYTNLGNVHRIEGDLASARAAFDRAIALDFTHTRAWALRGQTALRQGEFAQAAKDLQEALVLEPGVYETLAFAGSALLRAGDDAAALPLLETVARDRPDHARGSYALGRLRLRDGRAAEAVALLSRALSDPVLRPFALGARAEAWLLVGGSGPAAAVDDAEALCATCPDALACADAAAIVARAAAHAGPADAARWRTRAAELRAQAIARDPAMRTRLDAEPAIAKLAAAVGSAPGKAR